MSWEEADPVTAAALVAELDKEISSWLDVQKVAADSGLRQAGQQGGVAKVLAPFGWGAAGAVGLAAKGTHGGLEAAGGAALLTMATQVVRSPAWRTTSAVFKDR